MKLRILVVLSIFIAVLALLPHQKAIATCGQPGPRLFTNVHSPVGTLIPANITLVGIFDVSACKKQVSFRNQDGNEIPFQVIISGIQTEGRKIAFRDNDGQWLGSQALESSTATLRFSSAGLEISKGQTRPILIYLETLDFPPGATVQVGIPGGTIVSWGDKNRNSKKAVSKNGIWGGVLIR